jgi:hypothetical protein
LICLSKQNHNSKIEEVEKMKLSCNHSYRELKIAVMACVALVTLLSSTIHASLIGDIVDCDHSWMICSPSSALVVDTGYESELTQSDVGGFLFSVDVHASSIELGIDPYAGGVSGQLGTLSMTSLDMPGEIIGFSLTLFGDITDFDTSDIWIGPHSVVMNLNETEWDQGSSAVITLTPIPVPAAAWLFGSGLIGLIWFRKKIRKG